MKSKAETIVREVMGPAQAAALDIFVPEKENFGHYSTNVALRLAKSQKKNPLDLAKELADKISRAAPAGFFEKVEASPPGFVNFWITASAFQKEFGDIIKNIGAFGRSNLGKKRTMIVEYSQPNIGKVLHVGHLRTTIIGDALANIFDALGYKVIRWNYLGDWGTQFGKLIALYNNTLKQKGLAAAQIIISDINSTTRAYVDFHRLEKDDPTLEDQAREEFKKLEEGNEDYRKLWKRLRDEAVKELERIYKILGIEFNEWIGESEYEPKLKPLVERLLKDDIARRSDGAVIVSLEKFSLPPALIQRTDGASLYLTRDIASLEHRLEKYKPVKILYVVGNEQSLHFEQLFAVAKILGLDKAELVHVKYGLILAGMGKKLSTREGRAEPLANLIDEAEKKALEIVDIKNPDLSNKEKNSVAKQVGIGAVKYTILKENAHSDIVFNWEKMLDFSGDSAPYLQYTYARLRSILRKAGAQGSRVNGQNSTLTKDIELALIRKLIEFPDEVARAAEILQTSGLANYLYKLAVLANRLYETTPVLKEENIERRSALLVLIETAASVLKSGLGLLGIKTPEEI